MYRTQFHASSAHSTAYDQCPELSIVGSCIVQGLAVGKVAEIPPPDPMTWRTKSSLNDEPNLRLWIRSTRIAVRDPLHESSSHFVSSSQALLTALQVHAAKQRHEIVDLAHIRLIVTAQELRSPAPVHIRALVEIG